MYFEATQFFEDSLQECRKKKKVLESIVLDMQLKFLEKQKHDFENNKKFTQTPSYLPSDICSIVKIRTLEL